jgi:hypothetical protein
MKRITHFKGYDSYLEYDLESKTFVSKPSINTEQQPVSEPACFITLDKKALTRTMKQRKQRPPKRMKTLTGQQAALLV